METNIRKTFLIISTLLLLNVNSVSWGGGKQAVYSKHGSFAALDDIIPVYEAKDYDMVYASELLSGYVSIGVEQKFYAPNEQPKKFSLKLTSSTLRGILDVLIEKDPDYFWEMDNNVVNIIPKAAAEKDKYTASILNSKLPKVEILVHKKDPLVKLAVIKLRKIIRESNLSVRISTTANLPDIEDYMVQDHSPKGYSISVSLVNPTIRQALNAIVRADPPSAWDMEYYEDGIGIDAFSSHPHRSGILTPAKKDMRLLKEPKRKEWKKE